MQEDFSKYNGEGTTLRKAQLRMLDILIEIDKICRKHDIPYWLSFGTALGAVRHKGFIPWDEDVDISVRREDYKHLREVLMAELPERYAFQDSSTDFNHFDVDGRVRDVYSNTHTKDYAAQKWQGFYVDCYSIERVPCWHIKDAFDWLYRRVYREYHNFGKVAYQSTWKRLFNKTMAVLLMPFCKMCVGLFRFFTPKNTDQAGLPYGFNNPTGRMFFSEIFPLQGIEFEGYRFLAPGNIDAYLTRLYGDYMTIPSEKDRRVPRFNDVQFE